MGDILAPKRGLGSGWVILILGAYFATALNLRFWHHIYTCAQAGEVGGAVFLASLPVAFLAAQVALASLLLWPRVGKALLCALMLLSSVTTYFMLKLGIHIDVYMFRHVAETTFREASELATPGPVAFALVFGLLPSLWLGRLQVAYEKTFLLELRKRLLIILASLLVAVAAMGAALGDYQHLRATQHYLTRLINPTNSLYAVAVNVKRNILMRRNFVSLDGHPSTEAAPGGKPRLLVLVIGETTRAQNFSLNGYGRPTNPALAQLDVISFRNVTAAGTSTTVSVPAIFSDLPRARFDVDEAEYRQNLVDILKAAGYQVLWRENDEGCKAVCNRVPTENMLTFNDPRFCHGSYCLDEALIDDLPGRLAALDRDTVIVLHTMGSHGPSYFMRYPDASRAFQPTCDTTDIRSCSREELVNTYDNTIVYIDHVLGRLVDMLTALPNVAPALLYVSDHGESLGEGGIYMHAMPYDKAPAEQLKVPMVLWLGQAMRQGYGLDYGCLQGEAAEPWSHDNVFHSVLGLLGVRTTVYDPSLDIFRPCRLGGPNGQ